MTTDDGVRFGALGRWICRRLDAWEAKHPEQAVDEELRRQGAAARDQIRAEERDRVRREMGL